jgi:beta-phosphoglucomutase
MLSTELALVFDMDGVIVDSTRMHTEAWQRYLEARGVEIPYVEQRMLGKHNPDIVRDFFPHETLTEDTIFSHGAQKEALYREMMRPELQQRLVPGVADFLERNRELPIGMGTNAELANVDFVLDEAGLRKYFRAIVTGHEVARPKPFPDVYLRVAELLDVPPELCVVFEDSPSGVSAARAAGMRVVGLATTCKLSGVDLLVPDFLDPELELWLENAAASV